MLRGEEIPRGSSTNAPANELCESALENSRRRVVHNPKRPRSRPSTSSSPMNATAPSTISGARCSNTSTPILIGLTATPFEADHRLLQQETSSWNTAMSAPSPTRSTSTYDVYKIDTEITKGGSRVEKGFYVDKRDRLNLQSSCSMLITVDELDRWFREDPAGLVGRVQEENGRYGSEESEGPATFLSASCFKSFAHLPFQTAPSLLSNDEDTWLWNTSCQRHRRGPDVVIAWSPRCATIGRCYRVERLDKLPQIALAKPKV